MATRTHASRDGWGETHTLCGRDLNPSCGATRSNTPALSGSPTCKVCRERLAPPATQPRLPELKCRRCGHDKGLHAFLEHSFTMDA